MGSEFLLWLALLAVGVVSVRAWAAANKKTAALREELREVRRLGIEEAGRLRARLKQVETLHKPAPTAGADRAGQAAAEPDAKVSSEGTPQAVAAGPVDDGTPAPAAVPPAVPAAQAPYEAQPLGPAVTQEGPGVPPSQIRAAEAIRPGADTPLDEAPAAGGSAAVQTPGREAAAPASRGWSFEEALGAKVFVWIGGVALALAGAFLVKYSWENQLLSVGTRLSLAAVFGVGLIGAGAWLRTRSDRVAAGLAAAGVADLYGVVFAASGVYHLMGPLLGFVLLAGVTAGAVALSLRHGRFVALLGLVGGFCTPLLVGATRDASGPLLGYLLVLQIGLVVVTRQRGWVGLSAATLVGSVGWGLVQAITGVGPDDRLAAGALGIASAAVFVLNAARVQVVEARAGAARRAISPFGLALSALSAALALLGIVTVRGGYGGQELAMVGLLGAGTIVLARLDRRYLEVPWLTLGLSGALLLGAAAQTHAARLGAAGLGFAALYGLVGYAACWTRERAAARSLGALAAVGGGLGTVLSLAVGADGLPAAAAVYTGGALLLAAMAWWRARRRPYAQAAGPLGLAACGLAAGALLSAWTTDHERGWGPSLVLLAAGAAWATRGAVLRHHGKWAVGLAAWAGTLLTLMAFALELLRDRGSGSAAPFGVAAAGLVAAVAGLRPRHRDVGRLRDALGVTAAGLATLGAGILGMDALRAAGGPAGLSAGAVAVWFGAACGVAALAHGWAVRSGLEVTRTAASGVALLAGGWLVSVLPLVQLSGGRVPTPGWEAAGVYLAGAAGLWALGCQRFARRGGQAWATRWLQGLAWGAVALGVVASVRCVFHGDAGWAHRAGLYEVSCAVTLLAALAPLARGLGRVAPRLDPARMLRDAVPVAVAVAAGAAGLGLGIGVNPLLRAPGPGGWGWPVFNGLLPAFAIPAAALVWAGRVVPPTRLRGGLVQFVQATAAVLTALGVAVLIRHVFHPEDLRTVGALAATGQPGPPGAATGFREYGVYALALLGFAAGASFGPGAWPRAAAVAAVAGVGVAVLGAGGLANPLRFAETVGPWPVLNAVLWVLGGPALIAAWVAWRLGPAQPRVAAGLAGGAMVLAWGALTLGVRQGFVGADLTLKTHAFTPGEWYGYSAAWLLMGGVLLAAGVVTGRAVLRFGSLAVLVLAVGKVFLLDTRHLDGLLRALSFLGLGVVLMALGYVYQRYVFGGKTDKGQPPDARPAGAEPAPGDAEA